MYGAEGNRNDKKVIGQINHKPSINKLNKLGHFNESFMVFRIAYLTTEQILDWKLAFGSYGLKNPSNGRIDPTRKDMPAYLNLPGTLSTYESFEMALSFVSDEE